MFLALTIIIASMAYLTVAGMAKAKVQTALLSSCTRRGGHGRQKYDSGCTFTHADQAIMSGIAWPIVLPFCAGMIMADSEKRKKQKSKTQQREIEQRIERANLEKKAIEQERRNLDNSIRNMEIANNIGSRN